MTTYSFKDVKASISGPGGSFPLGDGAGNSDEGITVAMSAEKTTTTTGADGSIMHSLHASKLGTMKVSLLKTSPTNALLNALYNAQQESSALWGQNTITITNPATGDLITGDTLAFVKQPDLAYATEGNNNEWEFRGNVNQVLGTGQPVAA